MHNCARLKISYTTGNEIGLLEGIDFEKNAARVAGVGEHGLDELEGALIGVLGDALVFSVGVQHREHGGFFEVTLIKGL